MPRGKALPAPFHPNSLLGRADEKERRRLLQLIRDQRLEERVDEEDED